MGRRRPGSKLVADGSKNLIADCHHLGHEERRQHERTRVFSSVQHVNNQMVHGRCSIISLRPAAHVLCTVIRAARTTAGAVKMVLSLALAPPYSTTMLRGVDVIMIAARRCARQNALNGVETRCNEGYLAQGDRTVSIAWTHLSLASVRNSMLQIDQVINGQHRP